MSHYLHSELLLVKKLSCHLRVINKLIYVLFLLFQHTTFFFTRFLHNFILRLNVFIKRKFTEGITV